MSLTLFVLWTGVLFVIALPPYFHLHHHFPLGQNKQPLEHHPIIQQSGQSNISLLTIIPFLKNSISHHPDVDGFFRLFRFHLAPWLWDRHGPQITNSCVSAMVASPSAPLDLWFPSCFERLLANRHCLNQGKRHPYAFDIQEPLCHALPDILWRRKVSEDEKPPSETNSICMTRCDWRIRGHWWSAWCNSHHQISHKSSHKTTQGGNDWRWISLPLGLRNYSAESVPGKASHLLIGWPLGPCQPGSQMSQPRGTV